MQRSTAGKNKFLSAEDFAALYKVMDQSRKSKGQPPGGQFAAKANPESDTELAPDQPTGTSDLDGTKRWHLHGELHRTDGPAIVWPDGGERWYLNGKLHRVNGPAVTRPSGHKVWFLNGKRHRTDGPAIVSPDGSEQWFLNGKRHRTDGPAIVSPDGSEQWFLDGECVSSPIAPAT